MARLLWCGLEYVYLVELAFFFLYPNTEAQVVAIPSPFVTHTDIYLSMFFNTAVETF